MGMTLKAARVNVGLTQEEAAKHLSISRATLRNWEKFKSVPKVSQLKAIQKLYGVEYDELLFLPNDYALSVK